VPFLLKIFGFFKEPSASLRTEIISENFPILSIKSKVPSTDSSSCVYSTEASCFFMGSRWLIYLILRLIDGGKRPLFLRLLMLPLLL
jgi:hypothetical protein